MHDTSSSIYIHLKSNRCLPSKSRYNIQENSGHFDNDLKDSCLSHGLQASIIPLGSQPLLNQKQIQKSYIKTSPYNTFALKISLEL